MEGYKGLKIWEGGMKLTILCYEITSKFPRSEIYGLTSQINRAAVSVPANIAEGYGRNSNKEFIQFLYIALGSCNELDTLFTIAKELQLISQAEFDCLDEIRKPLSRMISALITNRKTK